MVQFQPLLRLPTSEELPCSDETPVDNELQNLIPNLLLYILAFDLARTPRLVFWRGYGCLLPLSTKTSTGSDSRRFPEHWCTEEHLGKRKTQLCLVGRKRDSSCVGDRNSLQTLQR